MKKVIPIIFTLILVSCVATNSIKSKSSSLYEVLTQQANGGASIRFFEVLSEENEIVMLQNDGKLAKKMKQNDINTSNFVVLNMGEKTSDGYKISIESVIETEKNIIITIKEISPENVSLTTQEVFTPYCVLKINSKKEILFK